MASVTIIFVHSFVRSSSPVGSVSTVRQAEYQREGIDWAFVDFPSNDAVLALIEATSAPGGVLRLIDEEGLVPGGNDAALASKLATRLEKHASFEATPAQRARGRFGVRHYAGLVVYTVSGFIEKARRIASSNPSSRRRVRRRVVGSSSGRRRVRRRVVASSRRRIRRRVRRRVVVASVVASVVTCAGRCRRGRVGGGRISVCHGCSCGISHSLR